MADRLPLLNSGNDLETFDPPEKLKLPTPSETLREWTEQSIDPAVMIENGFSYYSIGRPAVLAEELPAKSLPQKRELA